TLLALPFTTTAMRSVAGFGGTLWGSGSDATRRSVRYLRSSAVPNKAACARSPARRADFVMPPYLHKHGVFHGTVDRKRRIVVSRGRNGFPGLTAAQVIVGNKLMPKKTSNRKGAKTAASKAKGKAKASPSRRLAEAKRKRSAKSAKSAKP